MWRILPTFACLLALSACQGGSVGHEAISRCVPEGACDEAMFQAGLTGAPANPARGAALFAAQCATCHGPAGGGVGPTQAIDFQAPVWHAAITDAALAEIIRHGRPPTMPPSGLNDAQLRDVIAHLRSLRRAPPAYGATSDPPRATP